MLVVSSSPRAPRRPGNTTRVRRPREPLVLPTPLAVGTTALLLAWNDGVRRLQRENMLTLPISMGTVILYGVFRRYLTTGLVAGAVQGN